MRRHAFWRSRMDGRQLSTKFKPKPFKRNPSSFVWLSEKNGLKTLFHTDETLTKLYLIVSHYLHMFENAGKRDKLGIFMSDNSFEKRA